MPENRNLDKLCGHILGKSGLFGGRRMQSKKQILAAVVMMTVMLAVVVWAVYGKRSAWEEKQKEKQTEQGKNPGNHAVEGDRNPENQKTGDQSLEGREGMSRGEEADIRVAREGKVASGWDQPPCIVLDPGHGGFDPGKIGIGNVLEKDINLSVACRVQEYLTAAGVQVIMTRQEDQALSGEETDNKKVRDLKERIRIIEENAPVAAVSIHQNSYPEEYVHGAQVFYYVNSVEGKKLAQKLQDRLIQEADPENTRQIKDNNSYFLLKKTKAPLVIVECGFLSNEREAEKMQSDDYQDAVAWAVYLGIMDYLEECAE